MAEKPKKKSGGIKRWFGLNRDVNHKEDVNIKPDDLSEHRHMSPGDQTHDTPRERLRNKFPVATKHRSHKEKDKGQNISTGINMSTATSGATLKCSNTEMDQRVPTMTECHTKISTKISMKPEIFNQNQGESVVHETLLSTDTDRDISPRLRVKQDVNPGQQEKGASGYDRGTHTSVDTETGMKEYLASFRDIELRRITVFYRQRLEDAIEGFADGVGLAFLNENIINSQEYQFVQELVNGEHRNEASKFLFDKVFESRAKAGRAMWEIFVKMQSTKPKLRGILKEIREKGCNLPNDASWSQILSKVPQYLEDKEAPLCGDIMAEKPNENSREGKQWLGLNPSVNHEEDVNIKPDDLREHRHMSLGDQTHDTPREPLRNEFYLSTNNKSLKEKDKGQNISTGTNMSTATSDATLKCSNTEMDQRVPTMSECHAKISTKISMKPEIFNQNQAESVVQETLLSTDTDRDINPRLIVKQDVNPGVQEKGASGYDRGTHTSVDTETKMKEYLASFRDIDLRKITVFYRQRLEDAIEGFADGVGLALLNENIINSQEYQYIRKLKESKLNTKASTFLFDKVMEIGAKAGRAMWDIFVDMHGTIPKLREILQEMQTKGSNFQDEATWSQIPSKVPLYLEEIQHKYKETLIKQFEKMKVNTGELTRVLSLEDRYTEVIIVKRPLERKSLEHEIWAQGKKHEKWQNKLLSKSLEKVGIDQLFRSSFGQSSLSGTTVVTGVAGIGKTTIVQKIVHDWAAGKIYQQFNFVFLFKFRELRELKEKTSLKQLILDSCRYFGKYLERVWEEPAKILLIFDGLDEFHENIDFSDQQRNKTSEHHCFDPESRCEVSDIVRCLVQGKVLNGCSVLITSRPTALESLDKSNVNLWTEIVGFLAEERRDFCQRFFGHTQMADAVFKKIEENDVLYTMCYIPIYCWIICSTLAPLFNREERIERQFPRTITELFSNFLASLLKREGCNIENRRELLVKLAEMAFEGVSNNSLIFHDYDFQRHNLQPSKFTSGFMMQILQQDNPASNAVHTFTHLTLQEFLAALSLFLKLNPQKMEQVQNKTTWKSDGRFEIFFRFLVGLTSPHSAQELKKDLGSFDESTCYKVIDWLNEEVQRRIKTSDGQDNKTKLLTTFYLLYESQNSPLMKKLLESVKKVGFSGLELSPVDCTAIATVMRPCERLEDMDLTQCSIQDEGIRRLTEVLHKCKILRLNENKLEDVGVKRLSTALKKNYCKIERLELKANNLTDGCINELTSAIIVNQSVTELDLSNNVKDGNNSNNLTDISLHALRKMFEMNHHLKKISLKHNGFSAAGQKSLESGRGTKTRCNFD